MCISFACPWPVPEEKIRATKAGIIFCLSSTRNKYCPGVCQLYSHESSYASQQYLCRLLHQYNHHHLGNSTCTGSSNSTNHFSCMSDFDSLKRQRAAKNAKSYAVSSAPAPSVATETTKSTEERQNETINEFAATKDVEQKQQSSDIDVKPAPPSSSGLYASLPPSLDIRTSRRQGARLYSKYPRRPR